MKNILSKSYFTLFFLLVSISTFAFPGDSSDGGGLEGGDALPGAPIDDYIVWLAAFAILFALVRLKIINTKQIR